MAQLGIRRYYGSRKRSQTTESGTLHRYLVVRNGVSTDRSIWATSANHAVDLLKAEVKNASGKLPESD